MITYIHCILSFIFVLYIEIIIYAFNIGYIKSYGFKSVVIIFKQKVQSIGFVLDVIHL